MSQLKFSDLIDTPVPLSPAEAVALTLAVEDALISRSLERLPRDSAILLSSTGRVSLESVGDGDGEDTAGDSRTAQLAGLTRKLLQLDKRGSVDRRKRVPATVLGLRTPNSASRFNVSERPIQLHWQGSSGVPPGCAPPRAFRWRARSHR